MKTVQKLFTVLLATSVIGTKMYAFAFLIPAGIAIVEFFAAETAVVVSVTEAVAVGDMAVAGTVLGESATYQGVKEGVKRIVKPGSNYRKTALGNAPKSKGGLVTDPYSGKKCRKHEAHADHIWPKSKGGTNHSANLILSCPKENISKGNKIGTITVKGYVENIKQWVSTNLH